MCSSSSGWSEENEHRIQTIHNSNEQYHKILVWSNYYITLLLYTCFVINQYTMLFEKKKQYDRNMYTLDHQRMGAKICNILNWFYVHWNYPGSCHILNFTDFYITPELCNLEHEKLHPYNISYTSITDWGTQNTCSVTNKLHYYSWELLNFLQNWLTSSWYCTHLNVIPFLRHRFS